MSDSVNGASGGRGRPEEHRRPIAAQGLGHLPDVIPGALVLDAREPELEQCREDEVQVSVRHVHQQFGEICKPNSSLDEASVR
jgi:hypothetical protein